VEWEESKNPRVYLFRMEAQSMRVLGKFNISPVKEQSDNICA